MNERVAYRLSQPRLHHHDQTSLGNGPRDRKVRSSQGPRWYLYAWATRGRFLEWIFVDVDKLADSKVLDRSADPRHLKRCNDGSEFLFVPVPDLLAADVVVASDLRSPSRRLLHVS